MKALIDLNVLLDVTLNRPEFVRESAQAFGHLVSMRNGQCYVAQHAVTTLYYIVRKQCGVECARLTVRRVLKVLKVLEVLKALLIFLIRLNFSIHFLQNISIEYVYY